MGAKLVGGPLHSTLGHFSGSAPTEEERRRGVAFHQAAGEMARVRGVTLVEAINRFEVYFLTTMADLAAYLDRSGIRTFPACTIPFTPTSRKSTPSRRSGPSVVISPMCIFPKMIAARRGADISILPPRSGP